MNREVLIRGESHPAKERRKCSLVIEVDSGSTRAGVNSNWLQAGHDYPSVGFRPSNSELMTKTLVPQLSIQNVSCPLLRTIHLRDRSRPFPDGVMEDLNAFQRKYENFAWPPSLPPKKSFPHRWFESTIYRQASRIGT